MDTKELRIGNIVQDELAGVNKLTITSIELDRCYVIREDEHTAYDLLNAFIQPIELTEEWLIKLGFKRWGKNTYYLKAIKIHKRKRGFVIAKRYKDIKYVHQLQNIYQALMQEEL